MGDAKRDIFSKRETEVKEERKGGGERGGEGREESSQHGVKDVCDLRGKARDINPFWGFPRRASWKRRLWRAMGKSCLLRTCSGSTLGNHITYVVS